MSKFTRVWKYSLRSRILDAIRSFRCLPTPTTTVFAHDLCAEQDRDANSSTLVKWPSEELQALPIRRIWGCHASVEKVRSEIINPAALLRYDRMLQGTVGRQSVDFTATIANGRVTHNTGGVLTSDNRLCQDLTGVGFNLRDPTNPLRLKYLPPAEHVRGSVAVIAIGGGHNYYHWSIGALPRLELYEKSGFVIDYFYAPTRSRFQRESMQILGIPKEKVISATTNKHIVADQLIASSWYASFTDKRSSSFLHDRMTAGVPKTSRSSRRVFVVRKKGMRRITNEEQVFDLLKPLGFEMCLLERLSLSEQIGLFHNADWIVGPHGAGLTNLLYCKSGTNVVEIGTPYRPWTCFYEIAFQRDLNYFLYLGRPTNVAHFDHANLEGDSDIEVPIQDFREFIERTQIGKASK